MLLSTIKNLQSLLWQRQQRKVIFLSFVICSLRQELTPVRIPLLQDSDLLALSYQGTIQILFCDSGSEPRALFDYNTSPELFKTKLLVSHLQQKLGNNFKIYDQSTFRHFCEFSARIDLAIAKKRTNAFSYIR